MVKPQKYINFDGKLVEWENAQISVLTHALHYGSGVFEGTRIYKAHDSNQVYIFRLDAHIQRLYRSMRLLHLPLNVTQEEMIKQTKEVVKACEIRERGYIRHIVFRGEMYEVPGSGYSGSFGLNPFNSPVHYAIITFPLGAYLGDEALEKGAHVCVSSWERVSSRAIPTSVKATGIYINSILAKIEAVKGGYDEALLLDRDGFVIEGSGENLFFVEDDILYTPPEDSDILHGITRDSVIEIAENLDIDVFERRVTKGDLLAADEVFLTGTAGEITPVTRIEHQPIGDGKVGPITKALQDKFFEIVVGKDPDYMDWLFPVY